MVALMVACGTSHSPGEGDSPPPPPPPTDGGGSAGLDAGEPDVDAAMTVDATEPAPDDSWVPLTDEQAACLGLTDPACAGCHLRKNQLYLRPMGVPPPPPGIEFVPLEDCGIVVAD